MRKNRSYIILGTISVLLFCICYLIKPDEVSIKQFAYDNILNLAFIIITIVVVSVVWFFLGGDPIENLVKDGMKAYELITDGFKTGLLRAHPSSSEFATTKTWIDILKHTKTNVDMMGYSLCSWTRTEELVKILISLANKNVKIRIMIMDDKNNYFSAGLNYSELATITPTSMSSEIELCEKYVLSAINQLPPEKKDNISFLKINQGIAEMQLIIIDDVAYVTPYMYSKNTSDSPLFVCKKQEGGYYEKYVDEFNMLWKLNRSKNT